MNIQQRKALEKIISRKLQEKRNDLDLLKDAEIVKREKEMTNKNSKEAEELRIKRQKMLKETMALKEKIEKLGFKFDYDDILEPELPYKERENIIKMFEERESKLKKAETRLLAKVWGVETDFDSLMKDLEKELSKI